MDDGLVERFLRDGFVKIEGAFPPRVAEDCARLLWRETGYDPDDPGTWKEPVVRVGGMAQGPFAAAANSPVLHEAFDLLVGANRWLPRYSLGSFPLRFPHEKAYLRSWSRTARPVSRVSRSPPSWWRPPRTAPWPTPPAAPVTSTSAIPFWSTRPSPTTAPAPASWPSRP